MYCIKCLFTALWLGQPQETVIQTWSLCSTLLHISHTSTPITDYMHIHNNYWCTHAQIMCVHGFITHTFTCGDADSPNHSSACGWLGTKAVSNIWKNEGLLLHGVYCIIPDLLFLWRVPCTLLPSSCHLHVTVGKAPRHCLLFLFLVLIFVPLPPPPMAFRLTKPIKVATLLRQSTRPQWHSDSLLKPGILL